MNDRWSGRAAWVGPTLVLALSLVGSVTLCGIGYWSVTAHYDGITSFVNVVAIASCCAAVSLPFLAVPVALLAHDIARESEKSDA